MWLSGWLSLLGLAEIMCFFRFCRDSQMKGLYTALKCFMLEFWDLQQYAPTWNSTALDYFNKLPRNAEAKCIHLPESTRICQLKVGLGFWFCGSRTTTQIWCT